MIYVSTQSGRRFDLLNPTPDMVHVDDVAHALAHANRFAGNAGRYSVAEHSVRVAERVEELGGSRLEVLQGLVHDAQEAYIGDVSSPVKAAIRMLGSNAFDVLEARAWYACAQAFGVEVDLSPLVRRADLELCNIEGIHRIPNWEPFEGVVVLPERYVPRGWFPNDAKYAWKSKLLDLTTTSSCAAAS